MDKLTALRRELHQFPEVSGFETETAKRISDFLSQYPPTQLHTNVGTTGILAIYEGENEGKTIVLRCELDALPIYEINNFKYRSTIDNVSHKCGHDGHMAILCGVARKLFENSLKKGKVVLLFQPAEENGEGAKAIFNDVTFKAIQPDFIFALHNLPGFTKNEIVVKDGTFTCAVNSIIVKLHGKTSHAGEPEKGHNPAMAISEIIAAYLALSQPDINKENYCLVTPVYLEMGEKAYGISAGYGEVHVTVRSDRNSAMQNIEHQFEQIATTIAKRHQLQPEIAWTESFKANENNTEATNYIRSAAKKAGLPINEKNTPFTFGEDFGLFTQHYKGAMFGLGSGKNIPALHNPDYDFPDTIIESGVTVFYSLIKDVLDA